MSTRGYFHQMACNNAWANHRLLKACGKLAPGEFGATRIGFFPSLKATLNHILVIDWFYVDALEGGRLGPRAWLDEEPCAEVADLQRAQAAVDNRLIAVCAALSPADFDSTVELVREDRIEREPACRVLLHLFQHQIHHRGQAHAMLAGTSVAPPQLDEFFMAGEAKLRSGEFAELGLSEAAIWPDG